MSDLLERLSRPLTYTQVDGVTVTSHPAGPIDDLFEEAVEYIKELEQRKLYVLFEEGDKVIGVYDDLHKAVGDQSRTRRNYIRVYELNRGDAGVYATWRE